MLLGCPFCDGFRETYSSVTFRPELADLHWRPSCISRICLTFIHVVGFNLIVFGDHHAGNSVTPLTMSGKGNPGHRSEKGLYS